MNATFVYNGDGRRVKSTINSVTTSFVGSHYEVSGTTVTKYYFAGSARIAMRTNGTLYYLLSDHLGSTSLSTDASGNLISELRYTAWGSTRYSNGTTPINYTYTGQYSNVSDFGLMYYGARWYDNSLGRFAQADSIVPAGVQGYDRYAYANNNPIRYTDPSGHRPCGDGEDADCDGNLNNLRPIKNDNHCKGLECIYDHHDDSDITLPTGIPADSPGNCLAGEKCDKAEALAGVFLIASVDIMEAVFVIIGVLVVGPMAIVPTLEATSPLWIPANFTGAYLIFDSGVVKDFNRTAWGLK